VTGLVVKTLTMGGRAALLALAVLLPLHAAASQATPLAQRLVSSSYWERMRAFQEAAVLPEAAQPQYVHLLARGLQDPDMEFRLAAVRALSRFGDHAVPAIPAMVATLAIQHGEARVDLVQDIARLGSRVVPALIGALAGRDAYVVTGACEALALIGPRARPAVPSLERLLNDPRGLVRTCARQAVTTLGQR